ncbi:MAG: hypothetical protein L0H64_05005 [Pseudonocardia sp.]|nr:hypothetical protein [Pseudonocardia sp.]
MQFDPDDEKPFHTRRDELGERFAGWLRAQDVSGDPNDAGLLMDWKWGYADGALDHWTVDDVRTFLFEWCPRKLSASPQDCAEIPISVAAFVEFLAHTGLLRAGSPAQMRRYCERSTAAFLREMGNPANFGMAKSIFGGGIGVDAGPDNPFDDVAALLGRLDAAEDDEDDEDAEPALIGPVRLPSSEERLAAVRAIPLMRQVGLLAGYCASPGRSVTAKGNLRLADARHLVDALDTGDELPGGMRSAEDLPNLNRLVGVATAAGALRRQRGRLLAVKSFAALDEIAAYERVVTSTVGVPADPDAEGHALMIMLELLAAGPEGAPVETLVDDVIDLAVATSSGLARFLPVLFLADVVRELELLVALGVVARTGDVGERCPGCGVSHDLDGHATLSAAGLPIVVELAREAGVEVVLRAEPEASDAAMIADLVGVIHEAEWVVEASAWFAVQPDPQEAGRALVAEITAARRTTVAALAGLGSVEAVLGDVAVGGVRAQLGGPHDGLVLHWLAARSALDPDTVEPERLVSGLVDVLAAIMDAGAPEDIVDMLAAGEPTEHLDVLERIWRLDHPRLIDVLTSIGVHHPVKVVAKAARKALAKHRSRLAGG